jgi:hypothetical protein
MFCYSIIIDGERRSRGFVSGAGNNGQSNVFGKIDRKLHQPWRTEALAELSEIRHNVSRLSIIYLCQ